MLTRVHIIYKSQKLRLLGTKCPHNNRFLFIWKWSIHKYHFVKWTGTGKRILAINLPGHTVDFSHLQMDCVFYRNDYISSYDRHKQHVHCRAVVNIALTRSDVNEPEQYLTLWLRHYAHGEETVLHDVCRHCRSTSVVTCWRTSLLWKQSASRRTKSFHWRINTRFGHIVQNTQYTILKTKPFGGIMYPIRWHLCKI